MTTDEMERFVNRYAEDLHVLTMDLVTGESLIGILVRTTDYEDLRKFNLWCFIESPDILRWKNSGEISLTQVLDGEVIEQITTLI